MESQPPKPSEEPSGAPPAPEEPSAAPNAETVPGPAPASAGTPLPDTAPPFPAATPTPPPPAAAADDGATAEEAAAAPARRPRGRTSLLIATAALLGIVGGVATGYTVQADRKPTPLPPLSQAKLSYPDKHIPEDEWEPVPAKHDRRVKTDGDLRKLLLDKPKGARSPDFDESPDGWISLTGYAWGFQAPGHMLSKFAERDIRRVAGVEWESGQYRTVTIRLVQFRDLVARDAEEHAAEQQGYMHRPAHADSEARSLEGTEKGLYWVDEAPRRKPGYLPSYRNRAVVSRGDIMMDVSIYDTRPISAKDIRELAERQLERL